MEQRAEKGSSVCKSFLESYLLLEDVLLDSSPSCLDFFMGFELLPQNLNEEITAQVLDM